MTWRTTTPNEAISFPIQVATANYSLDCNNDGIYEQPNVTTGGSCTFPTAGDHKIRIKPNVSGGFPGMAFKGIVDCSKLREINQWGTFPRAATQHGAFNGCSNLVITATDLPDMSAVTDMTDMFRNATSLTTLGTQGTNWNTSNVTTMENMFNGARLFNQSLSAWNTTNVTNMGGMFQDASSFNGTIGTWDVGKVTNMQNMFNGAVSFNQNIGAWNITALTNATQLFS